MTRSGVLVLAAVACIAIAVGWLETQTRAQDSDEQATFDAGPVLIRVASDIEHGPYTPTPTPTPTITPTPTATPTTAPTATPMARIGAQSARYVPPEELRRMLADAGFPASQHDFLIALARCESSLFTHAVGNAGERGLFQIHPVHGWRWEVAFDPWQNVQAAYYVSGGGTNFAPWPNCP